MARSTTPTRRPPASFTCRLRLSSVAAAAAGACSPSSPRHPSSSSSSLPSVFRLSLPSAAAAAVVSRGGAQRSRVCSCSPTTHPGSFRCALHRGNASPARRPTAAACGGLHGDARRSAMANSLVRIAAVEGDDHVRRALAALIRPSSHHQRRRDAFRPRPSRLSAMSAAS